MIMKGGSEVSKLIHRTVKNYRVMIKDTLSIKILDEWWQFEIPNKKEIAKKYIKSSGNMEFFIDIEEVHEKRSMSIETFIKYSKLEE